MTRQLLLGAMLLSLATTPVAAKAKGPAAKWGQDRNTLFLTFTEMDCSKNKKVEPTETNFKISCTGASGKTETVSFELREPIDPKESHCSTVREGEFCIMKKADPHFFDRLALNPQDLPGLKQDWGRWQEEDEDRAAENPYEGVSAVKAVTYKDVAPLLKEGKVVFADVAFPWCDDCSYTQRGFAGAAKKLKDDKAVFVRMDAREDREARKTFNSSCSHECKLQILESGEEPQAVDASGWPEDDMVKNLKSYLTPLLTKVTSDKDVDDFLTTHPSALLAVLKGGMMSSAEKSSEFKLLKAAAKQVRGKVAVMYSDKALKGTQPLNLKYFAKGAEPKEFKLDSSAEADALALSIYAYSIPAYSKYEWKKRELVKDRPLPIVHVFAEDKTHDDMIKEIAEELRGKAVFMKFDKKDEYILKDFGLSEFPALGVADSFDHLSKRYALEGEITAESVKAFINKYLSKELSPVYKSEPVPTAEHSKGTVKIVVHKNLRETIASGSTFLSLYKSWAQTQEKVGAVLDKVSEALGGIEGLTIAKMETVKNHVPEDLFPEMTDSDYEPVAYLCTDGSCKKIGAVGGQKDVFKVLAKQVPAVKAGWESIVKPKLKQMKEAEAEKKRLEEEAKAAEEARKAEEAKKLEDMIASAEKIDVSEAKDEGIIKQIITEGTGSPPKAGDPIRAHYTGTLLDGTKFDSSRDRGDPFSFPLGGGRVIKCWDQAFATMKKGERAVLTCTAPNAYGERGAPPSIPPNATLRFDVELLDFGNMAKDEL